MLKVRPDKPLAANLLSLIRLLDHVASELKVPYFVIGAFARDILKTGKNRDRPSCTPTSTGE